LHSGEGTLEIHEYLYRERFGLSKREMLEEPYGDFVINSHIMNTLAEMEQEQIKKNNRRIKHGTKL